jgi:hypothetical protein
VLHLVNFFTEAVSYSLLRSTCRDVDLKVAQTENSQQIENMKLSCRSEIALAVKVAGVEQIRRS